jgi:glycosyltransferase involved in cell wall biosynthesis
MIMKMGKVIDKPLISVIITSYNYELYLKETIDSVIEQTYKNLEIIVVDDGSIDSSREIIKSYGDQVISVFKKNGGLASSINAGFAVSHGDFVCLLDSDDFCHPSKLQEIAKAAARNPKASLIYHRMQWISSEGVPYGKPWPYKLWQGQMAERVSQSGGWWRYPPTSGLCFRREFLEKVMNVPEQDCKRAPDAYLACLAPFFGEIVGVDKVLSYYRIHGANNHLLWGNEGEREFYETLVHCLNETLERLNIDKRVRLEDHWLYQYRKWQNGDGYNTFTLSLQALRFPAAHPLSRIKNVLSLLQKSSRIRRRAV